MLIVSFQEFTSPWQPLQSHYATASLTGRSRHPALSATSQCGCGSCHETAIKQQLLLQKEQAAPDKQQVRKPFLIKLSQFYHGIRWEYSYMLVFKWYLNECHGIMLKNIRTEMNFRIVLFFLRNVSAYDAPSTQTVTSPQRSKRVKENTPPRCAVVQNGPSSTCAPSQTCGGGGWGGEQACSTTRDHHGQHNPPRQTIVIPDTPSPAVSIITISSDTDEEDDLKQPTNTRSEKWDEPF